MFSVFRSCATGVLRQIWMLAFLLVSDWAYAINVSTSPVTMLSNGTGRFTISWTGAGYTSTVEESTNGGSSWSTAATGYNDSGSVTFTRAQGIWWYRIKDCTFVGPEQTFSCQYTATYSFSVGAPPATPAFADLSRTSSSSTFYVGSNWPSTATRFEWQERKNGGSWTGLSSTTDSGFARTVPDSGTWGYRVRACNEFGCSSYSSEMVVYVAITPGVPSSISVPDSTYGAFTVSWSAASGSVTKYELEMKNGSGSYSDQYSGTALSRALTVSEAGTYYFRVRACRTSGTYTSCSDWRTSSSGMVASLPPVPGSFTVPGTNNSGSYNVSWNVITGVTKYTLQERIGSRDWATIQDTAATSSSFSGKPNSRYSYRVRSCAPLGCSAYTASKTVNVVRARTGAATETSYAYDALGRLQFVEDTINGNRDYDYDSAGNRTAVAEGVLDEDEDPIDDDQAIQLAAPTGLWLEGPFSHAGGYTASWSAVPNAERYIVGMEDGSTVQVTETSLGTAILRPVWVYAVNYNGSSAMSYF